MKNYNQEVGKIIKHCYSNQSQIAVAVNTKRYIDAHFSVNIKLDKLAQIHYTSKYHLLRIFKRYYGMTPRQFMINRRIIQAKRLLKSGKTVSEACYSVGFDSIPSFSNLFKKKTGNPPSFYKKAIFNK